LKFEPDVLDHNLLSCSRHIATARENPDDKASEIARRFSLERNARRKSAADAR
jgi:hypothetical protein